MEEYVLKALSLGFNALGFSCHAPVPFDDGWHMKAQDFPYYLDEIGRLRGIYRDRIELYAGLELEYLEQTAQLCGIEMREQLDYVIASVHLMYHKPSGRYLSIDGSQEEFDALLQDNFHQDIQAFVAHYYKLQEQMIEHFSFDVLGHCDLIKKNNGKNRYFDAQQPWYRKLTSHLLKTAHKRKVRLEVNTGGIARGSITELYPSDDMIHQAVELGIPLVLTSDAHESTHLDFYFSQADDQLVQAGCRSLTVFSHGLWQSIPIV